MNSILNPTSNFKIYDHLSHSLRTHVILIGFKHVGKSLVGKTLAEKICANFIDLDNEIEIDYQNEKGNYLSCREIMQHYGEDFFRARESKVLLKALSRAPSIISLGGGAAMAKIIQAMIRDCCVIHITASQKTVFERIVASGQPAFCQSQGDLHASLSQLWKEREAVYAKIRDFLIINDSTVEYCADQIMNKLRNNVT